MKTRKEQLSDRAFRYAYGVVRGNVFADDPHSTAQAYAWQDGYRAAMRDVRKVVKEASAEVPDRHAPTLAKAVELVKQRNTHVAIMVRRWLRPLR